MKLKSNCARTIILYTLREKHKVEMLCKKIQTKIQSKSIMASQRLTVLLLLLQLLDVVIVGVVAAPNGGWSGAASPAGVVSMLEASGAPGGDSAWQVVATSSFTPCTTSKTATPTAGTTDTHNTPPPPPLTSDTHTSLYTQTTVLVNATGSYVVLQGVTPHVIARGHILGVNHNKGAGQSLTRHQSFVCTS